MEPTATNSVIHVAPPTPGQWTLPNCNEPGLPLDIEGLFGWRDDAERIKQRREEKRQIPAVEEVKLHYSLIRDGEYTIKAYLAGYTKEDIKLLRIHKNTELLEMIVENHAEGAKTVQALLRTPQLTYSNIKIKFEETKLKVENGIFTFTIFLISPNVDPNILDLDI